MKLPSTTNIFVDRRKTEHGKSEANRQRLLDRIKSNIKTIRPANIGSLSKKADNTVLNPVKVAADVLEEPVFVYEANTGSYNIVLIGNDLFERGDEFEIPRQRQGGSGSGSGAGRGGSGSADEIINITKEEYFKYFFEDCELPNIQDSHSRKNPETVPKHAGFQKHGSPGQLSVKRSFKNAFARKNALTRSAQEELNTLLTIQNPSEDEQKRISELQEKINSVPLFEELDLRYTKKERAEVKSADAVFIMLMDISGSVTNLCKTFARQFFSLQYAFIKKKYPLTDIIFIAHTDTATEMQEDEFFTTTESGGTTISPAFKLANEIIRKRYDASQTNIYLSYASDGDNYLSDNEAMYDEVKDSLTLVRHMCYIELFDAMYRGFAAESNAMEVFKEINSNKIDIAVLDSSESVFTEFTKIYSKGVKGKLK